MHPHLRAKFNETAAWEYARSMEGKPYGYHNMIFSWIDALDENYPPPLDAHVVLFFSIVSQIKQQHAIKTRVRNVSQIWIIFLKVLCYHLM